MMMMFDAEGGRAGAHVAGLVTCMARRWEEEVAFCLHTKGMRSTKYEARAVVVCSYSSYSLWSVHRADSERTYAIGQHYKANIAT